MTRAGSAQRGPGRWRGTPTAPSGPPCGRGRPGALGRRSPSRRDRPRPGSRSGRRIGSRPAWLTARRAAAGAGHAWTVTWPGCTTMMVPGGTPSVSPLSVESSTGRPPTVTVGADEPGNVDTTSVHGFVPGLGGCVQPTIGAPERSPSQRTFPPWIWTCTCSGQQRHLTAVDAHDRRVGRHDGWHRTPVTVRLSPQGYGR